MISKKEKKRVKKWRKKNQEHLRIYKNNWNKQHREHIKEYDRAWRLQKKLREQEKVDGSIVKKISRIIKK